MNEKAGDGDQYRLLRAILSTPLFMFIHFVVAMMLVMFTCRIVREFATVFERFELTLPTPTVRLISLSFTMNRFWYAFVLGFLLVDAPILFLSALLPAKLLWLRTCWLNAVLLAAIFYLAYGILALFMPTIVLLNRFE